MNPLLTQFVWYIAETYVPRLHSKLRSTVKPPAYSVLPKSFEARIQANVVAKSWNGYLTSYLSTDKSVLVLPVGGEMSRSGYYGFGNDFPIHQLAAAKADRGYKGAVMKFNTLWQVHPPLCYSTRPTYLGKESMKIRFQNKLNKRKRNPKK